jgi:flagellar basal body P-ring protein FlgI
MIAYRWKTWLVGLLMMVLTGCAEDFWGKKKVTTRPSGTIADRAALKDSGRSLSFEGTIGSIAYVEGARFMRVRGYGLVWGLNGQGSKFCPPAIRDRLLRDIRRFRLAHPHISRNLTAEELIDSTDTAVVEVTGDIPAGAAEGSEFDITISAATVSPDTRSLAGGYLLPCELQIYRESAPGEVVEGQTHAKGRGPVFLNPFSESGGGAAGTSQLEGRVLGGGLNTQNRRISLSTAVSSYATVRQAADAINRRFTADTKVADATSPNHIELRVPEEMRGKEARFIELIMHLPLSPIATVREARTKVLTGELARAATPPEDAALSLEGIGPSVIPALRELYTQPRKQTSYYAARTGVRLGDAPAVRVIARHATDPKSPFRMQAIRELGECRKNLQAGGVLQELLKEGDPQVRIRAYEALRTADAQSMVSTSVGKDPGNFLLDVLPSEGPPLIYARRTTVRRIALIGADQMVIRTPLFYSKPGKEVTLAASADDKFVTLVRKDAGNVIGEFKVPLSAVLLTRFLGDDPRPGPDKKPMGLGLDYSVVLDVLHSLCQSGALNARLEWEQQSIEDLVGPLRPMGRPESEL